MNSAVIATLAAFATDAEKTARIATLSRNAAMCAANLGAAKVKSADDQKSMPELLDIIGATVGTTATDAVRLIRACLPLSEAIEEAGKKKCIAVSVVWRNHNLKNAFAARFSYNLKYNKAEGFTLGAAVSGKVGSNAPAVTVAPIGADAARTMAATVGALCGHEPKDTRTAADLVRELFARFAPAAIAEAAILARREDAVSLAAEIAFLAPAQVKAEIFALESLEKSARKVG